MADFGSGLAPNGVPKRPGNLADVLEHLGRHDEALASIDRALTLFTDRLGSDHRHVATGLEIRERILAHASSRVR